MTAVLIVEDDSSLGRALCCDLTEYGFTVSLTDSMENAVEILTTTTIDVLLTDLRLGASDGIDLLERVRELSPHTRAVLMSGFASARDYQRAVELGAVRVLCKPFSRAELIQCIRQAIDCEVGFRGSVHGLSLVDVLQMFNYARRSVWIIVGGRSPGNVYLRRGEIIHAEHGALHGEPALAAILALPTGSISTSVLPDTMDASIKRPFNEVLLDALRSMDEASSGAGPDAEFDFDAWEPEISEAPEEDPRALQVLSRVRGLDGYLAACLVSVGAGGVVARDGRLDLTAAAESTAEMVRCNRETVRAMGLEDETEDILITGASHYHLLRSLRRPADGFVYLVLDRRQANAGMAKLVLANAVRAVEP